MIDDVGPAGAGADDDGAACLGDAPQFGDPVDVEHVLAQWPGAERRIEIRAAGQHTPSVLALQCERFVEGGWLSVADRHRPVAAGEIIRMQMISGGGGMSMHGLQSAPDGHSAVDASAYCSEFPLPDARVLRACNLPLRRPC